MEDINVRFFLEFLLRGKIFRISCQYSLNQFLKYGVRRYCIKVSKTVFHEIFMSCTNHLGIL